MSFEQEWAAHTAAAHTRLAGAGDKGSTSSGPNGVLVSSAAEKKQAASYIETDLAPRLQKAGAAAGTSTQAVTGTAPAGRLGAFGDSVDVFSPGQVNGPGEFRDWQTRAGLNEAMTSWGEKVQRLLGRVQTEMNGLRRTNLMFANNEHGIQASFTPYVGAARESANQTWSSPLAYY